MSTNPELLDSDDYPTEETIERIQQWPFGDVNGLLDFIASAWHWPDFGVSHTLRPAEAEVCHAEPEDRYLRLATGGWSGNEEIIGAFRENMNYYMAWKLSGNGGLHIFKYQPPTTSASP